MVSKWTGPFLEDLYTSLKYCWFRVTQPTLPKPTDSKFFIEFKKIYQPKNQMQKS